MEDIFALAIEVNEELAFLSKVNLDVNPISIGFSNEEKDIRFMGLEDAEKLQGLLYSKKGLKTEVVSIKFED